jgi:hypothetical protein
MQAGRGWVRSLGLTSASPFSARLPSPRVGWYVVYGYRTIGQEKTGHLSGTGRWRTHDLRGKTSRKSSLQTVVFTGRLVSN